MTKFNLEIDHEAADALLIAVLQESLRRASTSEIHPDDKTYNDEYINAANFVLAHFGGEPVTREGA